MARRWHGVKITESFSFKALIFSLIVFVVLGLFDYMIRPIIKTVSEHEAHRACMKVINNALYDEISANKPKYSDLVSISSDEQGIVTAVETNTYSANVYKTRVINRVIDSFGKIESETADINVGTLLNMPLLAGTGPKIEFKTVPTGKVSAEFLHSFTSAGINQTRHRLSVQITVSVTVIASGYKNEFDVPCEFLIADTVIVGKVPEAYTDIHDDESSTISKINDYSAESIAK